MVAIAVLGVIELPQGWLGKGVHVGPFEASSIYQQGVPLGLEGQRKA